MLSFLLIFLLGTMPASGGTAELDLVGLLVRDGEWEHARAALDALPVESSTDPARHHALRATILAAAEEWPEAARAFEAALAASDPGALDPVLPLQLAKARLQTGDAAGAWTALDQAPDASRALSGWWHLAARAARLDGQLPKAFALYEEGVKRFPELAHLAREQILLLVEMGLHVEARERTRQLLAVAGPDDLISVAEALRVAGNPKQAEQLLTEAQLRFPEGLEIRVALAASALDAGALFEAAGQLSIVAAADPDWADVAAEVFRKAGDLDTALRWNAAVPDPVDKARQRLGLLLEYGRWDQVLALEKRIERLGLLEDSAVSYALAYARFRIGDLDAAEQHLRRITDPQVFAQTHPLRAAITACHEDPWSCP